jgi:hypothetical protein
MHRMHILGAACAICCVQSNIALARLLGMMCPNPPARALSPTSSEVWVHLLRTGGQPRRALFV